MDFILGGAAACCAGVFSNPMDLIKTRQQLQGELVKRGTAVATPYRGLWESVKSIVRSEGGLWGLQKGLSSALSFQFVMNSVRLGTFETVCKQGWTKNPDGSYNSGLCVIWGGVSGVIGASLGCPFFMVKTQIQSGSVVGKYAVGYQHHHKGTLDALRSAYRSNGVRGLWRGYTAMVPRTGVGSSVQLSTFTQSKDYCQKYEVSVWHSEYERIERANDQNQPNRPQVFRESVFLTAVTASMVSGFFTVVAMTPFDVVATRLFNQGLDKDGRGLLYRNIYDCFCKTIKTEGLRSLYKGFVPNYWRAAPHTILNLTFWEQFKKWEISWIDE